MIASVFLPPRMFLQSLVASADQNGDNGMDFEEFEGFSDFGFVFRYAKVEEGEIWQGLREALESFLVCDERSRDKKCFPLKESNRELLFRLLLMQNISTLSSILLASGTSQTPE